ncbi:MAG TPA: OB-fold nucleic acid binding domain-containing protein, partial [Burkholderiaceae bacterium]
MPPTKKKTTSPATAKEKNEAKLAKLGLRSDMDFVLHLPMRYEDETEVLTIAQAGFRGGATVQVEGIVTKNEITFRPRRQLIVTIADDTGTLTLRFLNFYGSQVKQLEEGTRIRARADLKHGFFGPEMVHPTYKVINEGAPLPQSLTPVYPSGEGVPQALLRRKIAEAMERMTWADTLPASLRTLLDLQGFEDA